MAFKPLPEAPAFTAGLWANSAAAVALLLLGSTEAQPEHVTALQPLASLAAHHSRSAAACLDTDPMRGELASIAAAFDALGLTYTGQADRMNPHAEMALLWGLHQHLSTLGTALHSRPIFMEGQP